MQDRLTIRLLNNEHQKIEAYIKREYPKVKTVSQVVRQALANLLSKQ